MPSTFHDNDPGVEDALPTVPGYQPVSATAVAALVTGALSAVALVSPFFGAVPLIGIGLAILGLRDVSRPGAEKAGRAAALLGLALAVGFGAQATSSAAMTRWINASRARAAATLWLEAIRDGRRADAKSMCLPDATDAVGQVADRMADCGTEATLQARCLGASDELAGGWVVSAALSPCATGTVTATIQLQPTVVSRQGAAVEQWMIARCEAVGR